MMMLRSVFGLVGSLRSIRCFPLVASPTLGSTMDATAFALDCGSPCLSLSFCVGGVCVFLFLVTIVSRFPILCQFCERLEALSCWVYWIFFKSVEASYAPGEPLGCGLFSIPQTTTLPMIRVVAGRVTANSKKTYTHWYCCYFLFTVIPLLVLFYASFVEESFKSRWYSSKTQTRN